MAVRSCVLHRHFVLTVCQQLRNIGNHQEQICLCIDLVVTIEFCFNSPCIAILQPILKASLSNSFWNLEFWNSCGSSESFWCCCLQRKTRHKTETARPQKGHVGNIALLSKEILIWDSIQKLIDAVVNPGIQKNGELHYYWVIQEHPEIL